LRSQPPDQFRPEVFFGKTHWHQSWEIFPGIFTPGRNPVRELMDYAGVPLDLTGKRVLDIGPWNGCFSFECVRRGAAEVVSLGPDDPDHAGYTKLRELLEIENARYVCGSVYDLNSQALGEFDVVLFFGVLYHLRYPLLALDQIHQVCRDALYVESFIIDQHVILPPGNSVTLDQMDPRLRDLSLWQFYPHGELHDDTSNWFGPNLQALIDSVQSAGFTVQSSRTWSDRAAVVATKSDRTLSSVNCYERFANVAKSVKISV